MNNEPDFTEALHYILTLGPDEAVKRLKGMQGPEQGLVGEARSDSETRPAEEAKPGERDVGEIVERSKLLRQIDCMIDEAQAGMADEIDGPKDAPYFQWCGRSGALIDLKQWLCDTAEKRSDLSHS